MVAKQHIQAFVLHTAPFAERDLIATLLTPGEGRITAIAKNAQNSKRFPGGLERFRKIRAVLSSKPGRDMHLLLEMNVTQPFHHIETSYEKITVGTYATELIRELARDGADSARLFDLLDRFYSALDEGGDDVMSLEVLLHNFELHILELVGLHPSLYRCFRCDRHHSEFERVQCARTGEGLLCPECKRPGEAVGVLDEATLAALHFYQMPSMHVPEHLDQPAVRQQARRVIRASLGNALVHDLKSQQLLDAVW